MVANTAHSKAGKSRMMSPSPLDLFHYSAVHQVLICMACHYAIQPTAVARHLKDIHHLTREQRRPFEAFRNTVHLRDPGEVDPPSPEDLPVDYLPVEQGWQCQYAGCDYLCVSVKRMQTHWPAQHGCKGEPGRDWRRIQLQTFFRGNMTRYFTRDSRRRVSSKPKHVISKVRDDSISKAPLHGHSAFQTRHMSKMQEIYRLDPLDSWILENYPRLVYTTFVHDDHNERLWLEIIPGLIYQNEFLLHGLLACTAQYMMHLDYVEGPETLILRACSHQDLALPAFQDAIYHPTEDNCDALMAFSYLLVVYKLATDIEKPLSLLFVKDSSHEEEIFTIPFWLHFLREGCSMLCDLWDRIENGPVAILALTWDAEVFTGSHQNLPYCNHFASLLEADLPWSEGEATVYTNAALALSQSFATIEHDCTKSNVSMWKILGLWPIRVEGEFMMMLYRRHPGALVLLAYYCIILKQMESCWYFEGRAARLVTSILSVLGEKWHAFVEEPVNRVLNSGMP